MSERKVDTQATATLTIQELAIVMTTVAGKREGVHGDKIVEYVRVHAHQYLPAATKVYDAQQSGAPL